MSPSGATPTRGEATHLATSFPVFGEHGRGNWAPPSLGLTGRRWRRTPPFFREMTEVKRSRKVERKCTSGVQPLRCPNVYIEVGQAEGSGSKTGGFQSGKSKTS